MCFDPVTIALATTSAALTATAGAVSNYFETKAQNQAASQAYGFQQQQQQLVNQAATNQYNETLSRQHVEALRTADQATQNAQQQQLANQQRQATAMASASTAGITGMPLDMLFNEYQVTSGNISNNLVDTYNQIGQNMFFNYDNARRQAQSTMNQATPAPPYMAQFNLFPSLISGAAAGVNTLAAGYKPGLPKASSSSAPGGLGLGSGGNLGDFNPSADAFV